MKNEHTLNPENISSAAELIKSKRKRIPVTGANLPGIVFITSFPPRECGIATYSQDLISALNNKFHHSFNITVCPLESNDEHHLYEDNPEYILNTSRKDSFTKLAFALNNSPKVDIVFLQHEFGFFIGMEYDLEKFLATLNKEIVIAFHTVLPEPGYQLKNHVKELADLSESIVVMTNFSAEVLIRDYGIPSAKIEVIPHGTHLLPFTDKQLLKEKYNLTGRKILSTFGLLSSGKNIETTLNALPGIIEDNPDTLFLIIGKTHPTVVKNEGEKYREFLKNEIERLNLGQYVRFINQYLPLDELLEYLQLADIYLFTSKDRNQAVSGTFSYAISCGCPIVSTPIPHALEVLKDGAGVIFDFENPEQLTAEVNILLNDKKQLEKFRSNGLHKMAATAWENAAIAHAKLFGQIQNTKIKLHYSLPSLNLDHLKNMTTGFGMIQFAEINKPDLATGYTLDDNARAMIAVCQHFELTKDSTDLDLITIYLNFIEFCQQPDGKFLNYVDQHKNFTQQNYQTNLQDSNGRAVWALGYLISNHDLLPPALTEKAQNILRIALIHAKDIHSTRAMAFIIKGLYYQNEEANLPLMKALADRLVQMYRHEASHSWQWFESYLTYGNSLLPEALLFAWHSTGDETYKQIARQSFDFLCDKIFVEDTIHVISNQGWEYKDNKPNKTIGGEQPIDIAYTILALDKFYEVFKEESFKHKISFAFNWFLGENHLSQIIYNPSTGGCYDGLEKSNVNLNQGAESTVSYLMARLVLEKENNENYTSEWKLKQ